MQRPPKLAFRGLSVKFYAFLLVVRALVTKRFCQIVCVLDHRAHRLIVRGVVDRRQRTIQFAHELDFGPVDVGASSVQLAAFGAHVAVLVRFLFKVHFQEAGIVHVIRIVQVRQEPPSF